jgi:hypothetical protein
MVMHTTPNGQTGLRLTYLATLMVVMSGCLGSQVAKDGSSFRQALLDMYSDQAINNLICARTNQPFVQLAYHDLNVTDLKMVSLGISDEIDPTHTQTVATATGVLVNSMRTVVNTLGWSASLECDRTFNVKADPVADSPTIYVYYRAFAQDTGLLRQSETEPCLDVYLKRKCRGVWYWIPTEASGLFLQLVLKTAFLRGPDPSPPIYWQNTIVTVAPEKGAHGHQVIDSNNDGSSTYHYVIAFVTPTFNEHGTMDIHTSKGPTRVALLPMFQTQGLPAVLDKDGKTKTLRAQSSVQGLDNGKLEGRAVQLYFPTHPQLAPKSPEAVELDRLVKRYLQSQGKAN